ncbi:mechanosensitive channel protein MscS [Natronomonas pharaonis DSM 2160]|uniref:Mechanosensitive channel protein MscS n=1 Tax=Natronomonas pharaonis (strain ATCC 35678 / DSM 2160 / CIP 103997 / JCM 8858 / NBRC 14720 / NCIMB 2260 / Gabara) TaxID=348780 RepID=A0A1U7EYM6_NATPD|nr:mechanosensitive ion channel family protein [Natronomonas pharaonis]CAI50329.1 mechanosensitive channel protein MscS [Natronomonas pharaonis DSM 2160]
MSGGLLQTGAGRFIADTLETVGVPPELAGPFGDTIVGVSLFGIAFILLYVVGKRFILPLLNRVLNARDLDRHAKTPIRKLVWLVYLFVGITIAFGVAGYDDFLRSLATIAAAATLAIGFAMQDVLKNFVAGIFIFTERPFKIGDWIEWDDNTGVVEDISLRVTRVRTFDNELLTVPNSQLTDNVVKNPVDADKLRLKFVFGIGYDDDIDAATDIILEEARAHDGIMDAPEPSVRLTELGDSDVGLQSRIWIASPSRADFVKIRGEYVKRVKERFDEEGIDIPYPHRTLTGGIEVADGPVAEQ